MSESMKEEPVILPGPVDHSGGVREPATAWVVLGSSGQWSDWSQWAVCVCLDEQTAKDRVGQLTSAMRAYWAKRPAPDDDENFDAFWDRGGDKLLDAWRAGVGEIDDRASDDDEPHYAPYEVPLFVPSRTPQVESDRSRDAKPNLLNGEE